MIGNIIKIHSDFYYVKSDNITFECKLREKLKKQKIEVYVGDAVKIEEINQYSRQAAIWEILERRNFIPRPAIANIDQVIVTAALDNPGLDFVQLNRYLALAKMYNIPALICINKSDLDDEDNIKDKIKKIYEPLNYQVVFTSALKNEGIDELLNLMESKISLLCGVSGVGKSSLLNIISPELNLRTKEVSSKTNRGTHTTRHVEIIDLLINDKLITVADTPGFSYLKFDNILPEYVQPLFDEIHEYAEQCYFSDCLHIQESKCNVLANIDNIEQTRYQSYKSFIQEALEYKEKLGNRGHKVEKRTKTMDSGDNEKVNIIKLGTQSREKSRKTNKQNLNFISILDSAYYNNEDNLQ